MGSRGESLGSLSYYTALSVSKKSLRRLTNENIFHLTESQKDLQQDDDSSMFWNILFPCNTYMTLLMLILKKICERSKYLFITFLKIRKRHWPQQNFRKSKDFQKFLISEVKPCLPNIPSRELKKTSNREEIS